MSQRRRQKRVAKDIVKQHAKPKDEFSFEDVMSANGIETKTPKWLAKIGIVVVIEVLIAGIVLDVYGAYRLIMWIF